MALTYEDMIGAMENVSLYERYFLCTCVFHEDSKPSLLVWKDGWFRCLGCGKHGQWITLYNKANGQPVQVHSEVRTDWDGPNTEGAEPYDIAYVAYDDLQNYPSFGWYLEMRGLSGRIEPAMLGYWNGWYTIPIFNRDREFQNLVYRAAPHIQEATGKRYWYHGAPLLYVPDWKLVLESKYLIVTYGIFDALTLADLRIPAATPSNGKDSFRAEWLDDLRRVTYFCPDQDEEDTARKHARLMGWRGNVVYLDWLDGCKDVNDFHIKGGDKYLINQLTGL